MKTIKSKDLLLIFATDNYLEIRAITSSVERAIKNNNVIVLPKCVRVFQRRKGEWVQL